MEIETVAIDSLKPDPKNARRHPGDNLQGITASLKEFGQQKPIVVDGDGIIVAGNGTWEGAKRLGWTEIKIVRTDLKGEKARAYALADNRLGELSEWELGGLLQTWDGLDGELRRATGFSDDVIAELADVEAVLEEAESKGGKGAAKAGITNHRKLASDDVVKCAILCSELATVERALRATGKPNRGEAMVELCKVYLEHSKRQHDASPESILASQSAETV